MKGLLMLQQILAANETIEELQFCWLDEGSRNPGCDRLLSPFPKNTVSETGGFGDSRHGPGCGDNSRLCVWRWTIPTRPRPKTTMVAVLQLYRHLKFPVCEFEKKNWRFFSMQLEVIPRSQLSELVPDSGVTVHAWWQTWSSETGISRCWNFLTYNAIVGSGILIGAQTLPASTVLHEIYGDQSATGL